MLILHISDIHFKEPDCLNPAMDPEKPYRTLLLHNARTWSQKLGKIGALIVGGDIAYKGNRDEYEVAKKWIVELADACGCPFERIFVVPGNHDVDRNIAKQLRIKNAQAAIRSADPARREGELRAHLMDAHSATALFEPLAAYNDFASPFNCQVYGPDRPFWKQDLPLERGVILRLNGLTSTILSGFQGNDDSRDGLYLSPLQTVLDPEDNVVNAVISHHPPDWFMDQDDVVDKINGRAILQFFGHKHLQRLTREQDYVRFSAGAVNPDRNDKLWSPGYNIVRLSVEGDGTDRRLLVETRQLEWQTNPDRFRPKLTADDQEVFAATIKIPAPPVSSSGIASKPLVREIDDKQLDLADEVAPITGNNSDPEAAMGDDDTRSLIRRFWDLTVSQRRELTLEMNLITVDEIKDPEPKRYGKALLRAGEQGLLGALTEKIKLLEQQNG